MFLPKFEKNNFMKQIGLALFLCALALNACKRNYSCTCVEKFIYDDVEYKYTDTYVIYSTQKNKQKECDKLLPTIKHTVDTSRVVCTADK